MANFTVPSQLDIFSRTAPRIGELKGYDTVHRSIIDNTDGDSPSPLHFTIFSSDYVNLARTVLSLKCKIVKSDGSDIADETVIAPVNMLLHAMIANIDVTIGNNQVKLMDYNDMYPYKAAVETILNFDGGAKASHLQSIGFYQDTAGKMDSVSRTVGQINEGLSSRYKETLASKTFGISGQLHVGAFFTTHYIIPRIKISIIIHRTKPDFHLMTNAIDGTTFMVKILQAKLKIRNVKVLESISLAHEQALSVNNALYSYNHTEIRKIPITTNSVQFELQDLFTGRLPDKLIVMFVKTDALQGSYKKNPFNFEHFTIQNLKLTVNGNDVYQCYSDMDFENNDYTEAFREMYNQLGNGFTDSGLFINKFEFGNGYTFFPFDLTADGCSNSNKHLETNDIGTINLSGNFKKKLDRNITCVVYAEFENRFEISKERNAEVYEQ